MCHLQNTGQSVHTNPIPFRIHGEEDGHQEWLHCDATRVLAQNLDDNACPVLGEVKQGLAKDRLEHTRLPQDHHQLGDSYRLSIEAIFRVLSCPDQ